MSAGRVTTSGAAYLDARIVVGTLGWFAVAIATDPSSVVVQLEVRRHTYG